MTASPIKPMSYSALAKGYLRYGDFCCQFHTQFYTWGQCGRIQRTPLLNSRMGMSSTTSVPETQAPKTGDDCAAELADSRRRALPICLKKHYRAGLIAASVLILFILGLLMGATCVDPRDRRCADDHHLRRRLCRESGIGNSYILTKLFGYTQGDVAGHVHDYGTKFLVAAGLFNILAMVDAWEIATKKKGLKDRHGTDCQAFAF